MILYRNDEVERLVERYERRQEKGEKIVKVIKAIFKIILGFALTIGSFQMIRIVYYSNIFSQDTTFNDVARAVIYSSLVASSFGGIAFIVRGVGDIFGTKFASIEDER